MKRFPLAAVVSNLIGAKHNPTEFAGALLSLLIFLVNE